MTDDQKQRFIEEYNAAELLHNTALIDENVYRKIENTLLRTIIGHFAIECTNVSDLPYCTECPYFKYTDKDSKDSEYYYGAKCEKDNHETQPSVVAIKLLHDSCPLTKGSEEKE